MPVDVHDLICLSQEVRMSCPPIRPSSRGTPPRDRRLSASARVQVLGLEGPKTRSRAASAELAAHASSGSSKTSMPLSSCLSSSSSRIRTGRSMDQSTALSQVAEHSGNSVELGSTRAEGTGGAAAAEPSTSAAAASTAPSTVADTEPARAAPPTGAAAAPTPSTSAAAMAVSVAQQPAAAVYVALAASLSRTRQPMPAWLPSISPAALRSALSAAVTVPQPGAALGVAAPLAERPQAQAARLGSSLPALLGSPAGEDMIRQLTTPPASAAVVPPQADALVCLDAPDGKAVEAREPSTDGRAVPPHFWRPRLPVCWAGVFRGAKVSSSGEKKAVTGVVGCKRVARRSPVVSLCSRPVLA